jgi:hypothetical protein
MFWSIILPIRVSLWLEKNYSDWKSYKYNMFNE